MKNFLTIIVLLTSTLAKSQAPIWEWARQGNLCVTPHGNGEGFGVTTDASENAYITGFFEDTLYFGNYTLQGG